MSLYVICAPNGDSLFNGKFSLAEAMPIAKKINDETHKVVCVRPVAEKKVVVRQAITAKVDHAPMLEAMALGKVTKDKTRKILAVGTHAEIKKFIIEYQKKYKFTPISRPYMKGAVVGGRI